MVLLCYIPNCTGDGDKGRVVFRAPTSTAHKWMKYIPKGDPPFNPRVHGVCTNHFEERFIRKEEVLSVGGVKETFKLDPWELSDDAVPTIFGDTDPVPLSVESSTQDYSPPPDPEPNDATYFDDLIRFDSINGTHNEDDSNNAAKRKAATSGTSYDSKKSRPSGTDSPITVDDDEIGLDNSVSGRPAHLKREIVPPSRIRDSMTAADSDRDDEDYNPVSPESPPSPVSGRGRGRGRGRPRGRGGAAARGSGAKRGGRGGGANTKKVESIKIKMSTPSLVRIIPTAERNSTKGCFIENCGGPANGPFFKMPQMTSSKLKDWMRYIPSSALVKEPFDPRIHQLCQSHFDKKFIMNTPTGKILTGDAVPSIFQNYPKQMPTAGRGYPSAVRGGKKPTKSRVEIVDGYEIEYDASPGISPEPITVTIDDDDDAPIETASVTKTPTPAPGIRKPPGPLGKTKAIGKILDIKDPGYNLVYIYEMKERIQLPQAELWMFRMMVDKESKARCIFICEIVARLERLMVRRGIKIRNDLTFKVEANGSDFTQMFNETGNKVDSLYKLQEMILDLSAFKVCDGWTQFQSLEPSSIGRKIEGVWFANNCEGLNLNNNRCRPCVALKQALLVRTSGLPLNLSDTAAIAQIRKLPKDDPLFLQLQVQELNKDKTKLKFELSMAEKRESRLQDRVKMLEAGMKVKGKTVYVTAAQPNSTVTASQAVSAPTPNASVSPGKPSLAVALTSTAPYSPRTRLFRPRATTPITFNSTSTTFSVTTRPAAAFMSPASSLIRKQTPIVVTPTPMYPAVTTQNQPRHPHPIQLQQSNTISGAGHYYQPPILTPTFVLAQGSGHEIGHQAIETTQVIPAMSLGAATLPGINVTVQKSGGDVGDTEDITLLSL